MKSVLAWNCWDFYCIHQFEHGVDLACRIHNYLVHCFANSLVTCDAIHLWLDTLVWDIYLHNILSSHSCNIWCVGINYYQYLVLSRSAGMIIAWFVIGFRVYCNFIIIDNSNLLIIIFLLFPCFCVDIVFICVRWEHFIHIYQGLGVHVYCKYVISLSKKISLPWYFMLLVRSSKVCIWSAIITFLIKILHICNRHVPQDLPMKCSHRTQIKTKPTQKQGKRRKIIMSKLLVMSIIMKLQ